MASDAVYSTVYTLSLLKGGEFRFLSVSVGCVNPDLLGLFGLALSGQHSV